MTRIIMHGCNGHMGRVITDLVSKDAFKPVCHGTGFF